MTPSETATVLAILEGAYPWAPVSEPQARVWRDAMATTNAEQALTAVRAWVESQPKPPSIAEFQALRRSLYVKPVELPAASEASGHEQNLERAREAKRILAGTARATRRVPPVTREDLTPVGSARPVACPYCGLEGSGCSGGPIVDRSASTR